MRKIILLFILFLLLPIQNYPQKRPTRVNKANKVSNTEYIFEGDGFKITFPSKPKKTNVAVNSSFGKTTATTIQLMTAPTYYEVYYSDFPAKINNQAYIELMFKEAKDTVTSGETLLNEAKIYYDGYIGRELISVVNKDSKNYLSILRVFVIEQRLFLLKVVSFRNKTISQNFKVIRPSFADVFFNSFAILDLPTPKQTSVELPDNLGKNIKNSTFSSTYLGFSLEIPKDWNIYSEEQIKKSDDFERKQLQNAFPNNQSLIEENLKNRSTLFIADKTPSVISDYTLFTGVISKTPIPNFLPLSAAQNSLKEFRLPGTLITEQPKLVKFGGLDFGWFEVSLPSINIKQRFYVTNIKGLALQFTLIYKNENDLNALLKSLNTIKFTETEARDK